MGLITLLGGVYGFFITLATSGISLAVTRLISSCYNEDGAGKCEYECEKRVRSILKNGITYSAIFSISATQNRMWRLISISFISSVAYARRKSTKTPFPLAKGIPCASAR